MNDQSRLTPAERGRLGGRATVRCHGRKHMQAIGRKGGQATVAAHGVEHMRRIGRAGYDATCQKHWGGNYVAYREWLLARGLAAQDPFPANGFFPDPGPWPSGDEEQGA